jgi:hypothetical protein
MGVGAERHANRLRESMEHTCKREPLSKMNWNQKDGGPRKGVTELNGQ